MTPHVYRTDVSGSRHQQLTPDGVVSAAPSVCGDGTLLTRRDEGDASSIWRMDADGSNSHLVIPKAALIAFDCAPHGLWMVYGRSGEGETRALRSASTARRRWNWPGGQ